MEITTMSQAIQLHAQTLKNPNPNPETLIKIFNFTALSPSPNLTYAHTILKSLQPTSQTSYFHNTLIRAHAVSPNPLNSITLFLKWVTLDNPSRVKPDRFTYPFVFKACGKLGFKGFGREVHGLVLKSGFGKDLFIRNGLVSFYMGCREVSDEVKGLRYFRDMEIEGFVANDVTILLVLRACAETGALSIDSARQVFSEAVDTDVYVWTAMISGLASHGRCKEVIELFDRTESDGMRPDEKTMTVVLSACRNMGWVDEGLAYFKKIRKVYKLRPIVQHYGCVVDLLARSGRLDDAQKFIKSMPIEPDAVMLRSLIWGYKVHGDTERLEDLIKHIEGEKIDSCDDCGTYVLLGNVYASNKKWKNKANVRRLMNQKGIVKPSGHSRIEINNVIYEFTAGSTNRVEAENIYTKLAEIEETLRSEGYDPKVSDVLLEIDDGEKASQLLHHSEKLAVSFGLIKTEPWTVIRIVKNLRSCEDCHSFMKHVSRVYKREILIRDRIRFHCFKDGECSCRDYCPYVQPSRPMSLGRERAKALLSENAHFRIKNILDLSM
ncbi:pentatricopeptide repeat-containing protein [Tanacetum coccineum]